MQVYYRVEENQVENSNPALISADKIAAGDAVVEQEDVEESAPGEHPDFRGSKADDVF